MIDAVHGRVDGTARRNFSANRDRLIDGEDYFRQNLNEFRTSFPDIAPARGGGEIALITESGYMMLVKSLNDDLAWGVQRQLVKQYCNGVVKRHPIMTAGGLRTSPEKGTTMRCATFASCWMSLKKMIQI